MPEVRQARHADSLRAVLFDALTDPTDKVALRFGERTLTYRQLRDAATAVAERVEGRERVAAWAVNEPEVAVAVIGALLAGVPITPINPKAGTSELEHILADSAPELVLVPPGAEPPVDNRVEVDLEARGGDLPGEPPEDAPAIVVYTSGTTGPPKGAVLPRRAIASNLDALAEAWEWTGDDVVAHALPLFHVHGLILGTLGPVRRGGGVHHIGRFSAAAAAAALADDATMLFAVPTMYHRLAGEAEQDDEIAKGVASARLLVSGSAALPAADHERIEKLTGQKIAERYGMTETLMNTGVRASGERRPGYVGPPLPGVDVRLVGDDGATIEDADDETIGEIHVRGPNLFLEYLNRPDATAEAMTDGWFKTGDLATRAPDGYIRIVGRRATDLIKSGGFKIGAGEIEGALLEHPSVKEVAVTGEPDPDLGERIVAWVVAAEGQEPSEDELSGHVADLLTPHKRPRVVRFLDELPRNEMGKVQKKRLEAQ
jgi:malonyl-CoA/methylmalonyl-CoA synthetase